jgi:hypothetical protein
MSYIQPFIQTYIQAFILGKSGFRIVNVTQIAVRIPAEDVASFATFLADYAVGV